MLAAHASQFDFYHDSIFGGIYIGIRYPMGSGRFTGAPDGAIHKMHGRTNFAHGHLSGKTISALALAQALTHFIFTSTSGRSPFRARKMILLWGAGSVIAEQPQ